VTTVEAEVTGACRMIPRAATLKAYSASSRFRASSRKFLQFTDSELANLQRTEGSNAVLRILPEEAMIVNSLLIAFILWMPGLQGPRQLEAPDESRIKPPLVVLAGTVIPVALINEISTKNAEEGDGVYAQTIFPVTVDNEIVIPVDSYVRGRIVNAERAGRVSGRAELTINFHTIVLPSGLTLPIFASLGGVGGVAEREGEATVRGESSKGQDVGTVGGAAGTGAIIGAVGGGGKGAAIGASAGAAAGVAQVLLSRGEDLTLPRGTTIEVVLDRPLEP
jgi:hypothetical protein